MLDILDKDKSIYTSDIYNGEIRYILKLDMPDYNDIIYVERETSIRHKPKQKWNHDLTVNIPTNLIFNKLNNI